MTTTYGFELLHSDYQQGTPSGISEVLDSLSVKHMRCPKCKSGMHYEKYYRPGSYIALAVCNTCHYEEEF